MNILAWTNRCLIFSQFREMQIIRLKMGPAQNKELVCCFGLHVRTATMIIGIWHLVSCWTV